MNRTTVGLTLILATLVAPRLAPAAEDNVPILRIDAGGPISFVSSLAFGPEGKVLYAGGRDKVVHVWVWEPQPDGRGTFVYRPELTWRVPIGPRFEGAINAVAVSDDGRYVAAAGQGRQSDSRVAGMRDGGWIRPAAAMTTDMRLDEGTVYVFDTHTRKSIPLRGHRGAVVAVQFAPSQSGKPPILVSAAEEFSGSDFAGAIRVWDLTQGKQISALGGLPSPHGRRPGLSIWHSGNRPEDVRVAIGWGDNNEQTQSGTFRVWDAASKTWSVRRTYPHALTVATVPEKNAALAATAGQIGLWQLPPGGPLLGDFRRLSTIDAKATPLEVATWRSRPGGALDRAAIVIGTPQGSDTWETQLRFVDLAAERVLPGSATLWSGPLRVVSIAASPNGEILAASGNEQNDVLVYRTEDLLNGRARPVQVLSGSGLAPRFVAFAKRGDDVGLILSSHRRRAGENSRPQPEDRVFDIAGRALSGDTQGWRIVAPQREGWEAVPVTASGGPALELRHNGARQRTLDLQADKELDGVRQLDAWAVCGPTPHCPAPVAAVATQTATIPRLSLYDLQSGQELRRLAGHVEPIESLAFSDDGRMLVTVSRDRTICVWWLADIDETLWGKRGLVRGLKLRDDDGGVIVEQGRPPLGAGTRITGIVGRTPDGKSVTRTTKSVWDFYQLVSEYKPGQTIGVVVDGRNAPVAAAVEQAIDERKPLFSLYFPSGSEPAWIGWNPLGQYDARGRDVESSLGWHFNTGDPQSPTRFATSGEYRRQNYSLGLLEHLIAHGAPPVAAPPTPSMSLEIIAPQEGLTQRDTTTGDLIARTGDLLANIELAQLTDEGVAAEPFPVGHVRSFQWRLGDEHEPLHDFRLTNDHSWEADLSGAEWQPGVRIFYARLQTDEFPPRTFEITRKIRFQRPAPKLRLNVAQAHARTPVKEFALTGDVTERSDDVDVTIKVTTTTADGPKTATIGPQRFEKNAAKAAVAHTIELAPGLNRFEVIANNANALSGFEDFETTRDVFSVEFVESGPPVIRLATVDEADGRKSLKFPAGSVVSQKPELQLAGTIQADIGLQSAELTLLRDDKVTTRKPLAVKGTEFKFNETIALRPGVQTVNIQATTAGGRTDEFLLTIDYQPPTPFVQLKAPDSPQITVTEPSVEIEAALTSPAGIALADQRLAETATIYVNGVAVDAEIDIAVDEQDPQRGVLTTAIAVPRGENRIELSLKNPWAPAGRMTLFDVRYKIPPRIGDISLRQTTFPHAVATCVIESPAELEAPVVTLTLNGQRLPQDMYDVRALDANNGRYELRAERIPLAKGTNTLIVTATNQDGKATRSSRETVRREPPPPPVVRIDSPTTDRAIQSSRVAVALTVRSPSQLQWVDLISRCPAKGKEERIRLRAEELPTEKTALGEFELVKSVTVELEPGATNEILLQAANDGGVATTTPVRLNILNEPVRVVVDQILVPADNEPGLGTIFQAGRNEFVSPVGHGQVTLVGHVEWSSDAAAPAAHERFLRISVNGFLQLARLEPTAPGERRAKFTAPIVLNRREENRIRVQLPDAANEATAPYFAECTNPETRQHLHLVMVGVAKDETSQENSADGVQLEKHAFEAFHVLTPDSVFAGHDTYGGPLVGKQATTTAFRRQLRRMKIAMNRRKRNNQPNDVVIFYYQGKEVLNHQSGDVVLATHDNWVAPESNESAITGAWLNRYFNNIPGAHLVFLETERAPVDSLNSQLIGFNSIRDRGTLGLLRVVRGGVQPESDLLLAVEQSMTTVAEQQETDVRLGPLRDAVGRTVAQRGLDFESEVHEDLQNLVLLRRGE